MEYKVGDKVVLTGNMINVFKEFNNKIVTISKVGNGFYRILDDDGKFMWFKENIDKKETIRLINNSNLKSCFYCDGGEDSYLYNSSHIGKDCISHSHGWIEDNILVVSSDSFMIKTPIKFCQMCGREL